jgi:hypothetical protein
MREVVPRSGKYDRQDETDLLFTSDNRVGIFAIVAAYLSAAEITKRWFFRRFGS